MEEKMNLYKKMEAITSELKTVAKNLEVKINNKGASYKAVSEADVLNAVKPLEEKYGVYSYPKTRDIVDKGVLTTENEYGTKNTLYLRVKTIYVFVNIDNPEETLSIETYGDGLDTGDKAPRKSYDLCR